MGNEEEMDEVSLSLDDFVPDLVSSRGVDESRDATTLGPSAHARGDAEPAAADAETSGTQAEGEVNEDGPPSSRVSRVSASDLTPRSSVSDSGRRRFSLLARSVASSCHEERDKNPAFLSLVSEVQLRKNLRQQLLKLPRMRSSDDLKLLTSDLIRLAPGLLEKFNEPFVKRLAASLTIEEVPVGVRLMRQGYAVGDVVTIIFSGKVALFEKELEAEARDEGEHRSGGFKGVPEEGETHTDSGIVSTPVSPPPPLLLSSPPRSLGRAALPGADANWMHEAHRRATVERANSAGFLEGGSEKREALRRRHWSTRVGEAGAMGTAEVPSENLAPANGEVEAGDTLGPRSGAEMRCPTPALSETTSSTTSPRRARGHAPGRQPRMMMKTLASNVTGMTEGRGGVESPAPMLTSPTASRRLNPTLLAWDPDYGRRIRVLSEGDDVGDLWPLVLPPSTPAPQSAVVVEACEVIRIDRNVFDAAVKESGGVGCVFRPSFIKETVAMLPDARGPVEEAIIDVYLQTLRFFKQLPHTLRRKMAAKLVVESLGMGQVLFRKDYDPGDCFYVITSGVLASHDGEGANDVMARDAELRMQDQHARMARLSQGPPGGRGLNTTQSNWLKVKRSVRHSIAGERAARRSMGSVGLLQQFAQHIKNGSARGSAAGPTTTSRPISPVNHNRGRHVSMDQQRRMSTLAAFVKSSAAESLMKAARDGVNGGLIIDDEDFQAQSRSPPRSRPHSATAGRQTRSRPHSPTRSTSPSPRSFFQSPPRTLRSPSPSPTSSFTAASAAAAAEGRTVDPQSYAALALKHGRVQHVLRTGEAVGEKDMLHNSNRRSTVVCHADSTVIRIDRAEYLASIRAIQEMELDKLTAFIAKVPAVAAAQLNRDVLLRVVYSLRPLHLRRGETVFEAGTEARGVYFVQEGAVHITAAPPVPQHSEGHEVDFATALLAPKTKKPMVLAVLGESSFFGEEPLLQHDLTAIEALQDADVDTAAAAAALTIARNLAMPYGAVAAKASKVFVLDREHMSHGAGAELLAALRTDSHARMDFREGRTQLAEDADAVGNAGVTGMELGKRRMLAHDITRRVDEARRQAFLGVPLTSIMMHEKIGGGGKTKASKAAVAENIDARKDATKKSGEARRGELTLEGVMRRVRALTVERKDTVGKNTNSRHGSVTGVGSLGSLKHSSSGPLYTAGHAPGTLVAELVRDAPAEMNPAHASDPLCQGGLARQHKDGTWKVGPGLDNSGVPEVIRPAVRPSRAPAPTRTEAHTSSPRRQRRPVSAIGVFPRGRSATTTTGSSTLVSYVCPSPCTAKIFAHVAEPSGRGGAPSAHAAEVSMLRRIPPAFDEATLRLEHPALTTAMAVGHVGVIGREDVGGNTAREGDQAAVVREGGEESPEMWTPTHAFPARAVRRASRVGVHSARGRRPDGAFRRR